MISFIAVLLRHCFSFWPLKHFWAQISNGGSQTVSLSSRRRNELASCKSSLTLAALFDNFIETTKDNFHFLQSTPTLWHRRLWRWQLGSASSLSYGIGTATACSQLPLYDTEDYGGDTSAVQVPWATELAQPWLAESTGFTTQDRFLRFSLNHATKTYLSGRTFAGMDSWDSLNHRRHPWPEPRTSHNLSRWNHQDSHQPKKRVKQKSLHDNNWITLNSMISSRWPSAKKCVSQKKPSWQPLKS